MAKALKWHGGKHYLSTWILSLTPPSFDKYIHRVFPYFGGGGVFETMPREGYSWVVNDINRALTNFWSVLAHEDLFAQLKRLIEATPFSKEYFDAVIEEQAFLPQCGLDVGAARAFFIKHRQSRQGLGKSFATLSKRRTRKGMNEQASSWLSAIEGLPEVHADLRGVVIYNEDALDVIDREDSEVTWFYLDPPYPHWTRVTTDDYDAEMSYDQHVALLNKLCGINGKFQLSTYPNELYEAYATEMGWHVECMPIDNKASSKSVKDTKVEVLYMNYVPERTDS